MSLTLVTPPAAEPISLAEARLHCNLGSDTTWDTLLTLWIQDAREDVEDHTHRALITQTWRQKLDAFPAGADDDLKLLKPPVQSITSVTYLDTNGDSQTLNSSLYVLDAATLPGYLKPAYGTTWPNTYDVINAVTITMVCGYGAAGSDVPAKLRAWMLGQIAYSFAQREQLDATGRATKAPGRFFDRKLDAFVVYGL